MEMLPVVSFIIYSTGLCTVALLGLSISDVIAERVHARATNLSDRASTALPEVKPAPAKPAKPIREQLLKAA